MYAVPGGWDWLLEGFAGTLRLAGLHAAMSMCAASPLNILSICLPLAQAAQEGLAAAQEACSGLELRATDAEAVCEGLAADLAAERAQLQVGSGEGPCAVLVLHSAAWGSSPLSGMLHMQPNYRMMCRVDLVQVGCCCRPHKPMLVQI